MNRRRSAERKPIAPSGSGRPGTGWIVAGGLGVVALLALILATVGAGGSEPAETTIDADGTTITLRQSADVAVTGAPLPAYPESGSDPALGLAMPELAGVSFDGTPVTIADDGTTKVIILLAHW